MRREKALVHSGRKDPPGNWIAPRFGKKSLPSVWLIHGGIIGRDISLMLSFQVLKEWHFVSASSNHSHRKFRPSFVKRVLSSIAFFETVG